MLYKKVTQEEYLKIKNEFKYNSYMYISVFYSVYHRLPKETEFIKFALKNCIIDILGYKVSFSKEQKDELEKILNNEWVKVTDKLWKENYKKYEKDMKELGLDKKNM